MSEPIWFRLEGLTQSADDTVASIWAGGAAGVEIQDGTTFMENDAIPPVPDGLTRVIAFFESSSGQMAEPQFDGLSDTIWGRYDDRSWETAWKEYFKPTLLSPGIRVGPPWEKFEAPAGGHKVIIEPGMAFGTGTHETTQLCSTQLETLVTPGCSILDVGCGSAILSICARKLGSGQVTGIDLNDDVLDNARENLRLNSIDGVELTTTSLDRITGTFDLVIGNILAHILMDLREDLVARVRTGGLLLMSGLTLSQEDEFKAHFDLESLTLQHRDASGEWVCLVYEKS